MRAVVGRTRRYEARGILFDMDGTLVDSTAVVDRTWTELAVKLEIDPGEVVGRYHGMPLAQALKVIDPTISAARAAHLNFEFVEAEKQHLDGLVATPGAVAIVRALDPARWAVVTSAPRDLALARFVQVGLPLPRVLISIDDVRHGKPHPEPFERGASALGLDPSQCLAIEDAPAGVASAEAAGCQILGLLTTYSALSCPVVDDLRAVRVRDTGEYLDVFADTHYA